MRIYLYRDALPLSRGPYPDDYFIIHGALEASDSRL